MTERIGVDCKAYRNTATYGTPTWDEMTLVQDVTVDLSRAEAAFKARGMTWVEYKAGLIDADISVTFLYSGDATDADFVAFRDAFTGNTLIDCWLLDGGSAVSGSQGLRAELVVTGMSRPEPLEDALTVTFKCRPIVSANAQAWNVVA